ncbi:hypothetical protein [Actinomadura sp. 21ATH]
MTGKPDLGGLSGPLRGLVSDEEPARFPGASRFGSDLYECGGIMVKR